MALKDIHDTLEEIPEVYRELYTQKGERFECTGISGMKTSADVARVQAAHNHEKDNHRETKAKLEVWGELVHGDVVKSLDRIEELEAAAGGKLDGGGSRYLAQPIFAAATSAPKASSSNSAALSASSTSCA